MGAQSLEYRITLIKFQAPSNMFKGLVYFKVCRCAMVYLPQGLLMSRSPSWWLTFHAWHAATTALTTPVYCMAVWQHSMPPPCCLLGINCHPV